MALHGHTKIELTDVKTGEKQIIEKDNMFTNYIRDLIRPRGPRGGNFFNAIRYESSQDKTYIQELLGGIVCFADNLTEDPDAYDVINSHEITAKASLITATGTESKTGNFNSLLSSVGNNSATFVYDWDMEHGNGTISAVSLMPFRGAAMGNGGMADPGNVDKIYRGIAIPGFYVSTSKITASSSTIVYVSFSENKAYFLVSWTYSTRKITLIEVDVPLTKYSLFNNDIFYPREPSDYFIGYDENKIRATVIDLASILPNARYIAAFLNGEDVYLINGTSTSASFANNAKVPCAKLNLKTKTVTDNSFYNTSGENILIPMGEFSSAGTTHVVCNGYGVIRSASNKLYGIDFANKRLEMLEPYDDTVIISGTVTGASNMCPDYFNNYRSFFAICSVGGVNRNSLLSVRGKKYGILYSYSNSGYSGEVGLRSSNSLLASTPSRYSACPTDVDVISVYALNSGVATGHYIGFGLSLHGLSTINNLDAPVTKTADQTMRITYTLTEEE